MSEGNDWDALIDEYLSDIAPTVAMLVTEVTGELGDAAVKYGAKVAGLFKKWVKDQVGKSEDQQHQNFLHMKFALQNIATKEGIKLHRLTMEKLSRILDLAGKIALKAIERLIA
jgi:hypothetical protein